MLYIYFYQNHNYNEKYVNIENRNLVNRIRKAGKKKLKKVIFDLDGTLYETNSSILGAVGETRKDFGLAPVSDAEISRHIGKTLDTFLAAIFPECVNLEAVREAFRLHERTAVMKHGRLFPGIRRLLKELTDLDFSLSICSNGSEGYIGLVLESMGIGNFFTERVSSKYCSSKGEAVVRIAAPAEFAIVVGDTIIDLEAAGEAKLPSIMVTYGYGRNEDDAKAEFIADSPEEVLQKVLLAELFHRITKELIEQKKSRIIGINGVDTSGKTIFTGEYSRYLKSIGIKNQILHMDDFHNPRELRYQGNDEVEAYYRYAFNYPQAIEEILKPIKEQGCLDTEVTCLNLDTDRYETVRHYNLEESAILLVEGVLLFREPLLPYLDGRVFLSISFEEVLNRARLRDVPKYGEEFLNKYITKYIPIQKRYLTEHKPMEESDIVIDNTDYHRPMLLKP